MTDENNEGVPFSKIFGQKAISEGTSLFSHFPPVSAHPDVIKTWVRKQNSEIEKEEVETEGKRIDNDERSFKLRNKKWWFLGKIVLVIIGVFFLGVVLP